MAVHRTSDGRSYVVREIQPVDRAHLLAGLAKMSPTTRYHRFHTDRTDFSSAELDFLIACDGKNHMAYVCRALDEAGCEGEGIAVARVYRDLDDPAWGEVAIVVIDAWQGVGLGSILLSTLAEHCRNQRITGWKATLIADNDRAAHMFAKIGTITHREWQDRSLTLSIDIRP